MHQHSLDEMRFPLPSILRARIQVIRKVPPKGGAGPATEAFYDDQWDRVFSRDLILFRFF